MLELARLADRQAINTLAQQIHRLHVNWRPDIFCAEEELYPQDRFQEAISHRELYVARMDGTVIGYVRLEIRNSEGSGRAKRRIMQIHEICVEELCRNHGIGQEMMADVRVLAKAFGCTDLQLSVYPQNDEAVSFYQKCGFTIRSIDMQRKV